jgi:hypothetical protein
MTSWRDDLGTGGPRSAIRGKSVTGPKVTSAHIQLRPRERKRYARWWVEQSGLPLTELRDIARAIWSDHVLDQPGNETQPGQFDPARSQDGASYTQARKP